ncbi:AAEL004331-PA [Aedes aegypti]|uniref:AAEL004331-PA n=1 Tax=Aedes aegypti TaxID=7159 RepID=Q17D43_AEDAE|nr:AAEL004331-PA [Aedes aegypti]
MVAFRLVIPIYMVMALSQFITYLLILIVGEKENHIKEGLKIMGLRDSVFWCGWFIIYAVFVTFLTFVSVILLFSLGVFQHTNYLPVFILILLYSFSVILIGFMITPFFDNSRTAGILGNFAVNIMSLLYFLQVFIDDTHTSAALWTVSLISPTGFALAMDKILVLDISGQGVTLDNLWTGPGIPIGGSILMLVVDILLYAGLAFYFDCVIPSDHGTKQRPCFCLSRHYWCKKKVPKVPLLNGESANSFNNLDEQRDVEPVSREMRGKEAIRIVDLYKTFHSCRKPAVNAVNGINLTIYEGQITAILGHNGAGKSTLFNILTGLTSPTSGTVYIFGYDIRDPNDMTMIRRMTGVCPQHDILFETLTPKEHLYFFAAVRGIAPNLVDSEVKKTLRDIDLYDAAETRVKYLSGGQKRKLSVGIAIIGDPKIIILDEPTAGVDPYSRRHMWSILQNRKHGKVILLTTHFMDEADILAERKAVVSRGRLRCCGSSLFLKNKFGIGYHLTLVLDSHACEVAITKLVNDHVPKAEKARRHGRELSYILPHDAVNSFVSLFDDIENEIKTKRIKLGICSYGVSMTTLEEVFLHLETQREEEQKVETEDDDEQDIQRKRHSRSRNGVSKSTKSVYEDTGNNSSSVVKLNSQNKTNWMDLEDIVLEPSCLNTIIALLKLRITILFRDIQRLYLLIILPLAFTALGLYLNSIQVISPKHHQHQHNAQQLSKESSYLYHRFIAELKQSSNVTEDYDGNFSLLLDIAPHMAAFNINSISWTNVSITTLYNDTTQHSLPVILNLISNSLLRLFAEHSQPSSITPPATQTTQPQEFNIGTFSSALFVGMIFVLIPVSLAVDMVYDREMKARNQLRVNGLSSSLYLSAYFIVLSVLMILICAALLGLVYLFDIPSFRQPPALITLGLLVFLYSPAGILCSTCFSYFFDRTDSAQSILPNILTFVGLIPFILVNVTLFVITFEPSKLSLELSMGIVNLIQFAGKFRNSKLCFGFYPRKWLAALFSCGCLLHIPIWAFCLRISDVMKSGGRLRDLFHHKASEEDVMTEDQCIGEHEDEDVRNERSKVFRMTTQEQPGQIQPVVLVKVSFRWFLSYDQRLAPPRKKVSVRSLSFAVDAGEVLGLLGHNGAGKTTTMKIMTGETMPTRGTVRVAGHSITINQDDAFKTLGYCPQHDALWKNITVREHLELYARIRGVARKDMNRLISTYLKGLHISEHANKQTQHCSGGTRRKLSYAMAMVGSPKVVLLDEPSTGMDPKSKRFLWDTILASFHGKRCAMLTTHSMEEADALCSRVGIMVKGELRCLGSTQHLKNLYGAGYTLEIKLKHIESVNCIDNRSMALRNFVTDLFPSATLEESFADRLVYSVPQQAVSSLAECFSRLEKAKTELDIEEYSFSQTTLEQVFLKFAHYDEETSSVQ